MVQLLEFFSDAPPSANSPSCHMGRPPFAAGPCVYVWTKPTGEEPGFRRGVTQCEGPEGIGVSLTQMVHPRFPNSFIQYRNPQRDRCAGAAIIGSQLRQSARSS
jgi:hypothetical protein